MFIKFHSEIRVDELVQSYRPFIKMLDGNQKTIQSPAILLKRKKLVGNRNLYIICIAMAGLFRGKFGKTRKSIWRWN